MKHNGKQGRRWLAILCALTMLLTLCACGNRAQGAQPVSTEAPTAAPAPTATPAPTPAPTPDPTAAPEAGGEEALYGTPWVFSLLADNVPDTAPAARDDLYLHYNYAAIAEHAGTYYAQPYADPTAITDHAIALLDGTATRPADAAYSEAELEQLRIVFSQAEDLDALAAAGLTELQPWLDRIAAAGTLEELERVLVSEDFPFSPYLLFAVSAWDMSQGCNVFVYPHFLFVDDANGAEYLQDYSDDPLAEETSMTVINQHAIYVLADLLWLGCEDDAALEAMQAMFTLEESYGRLAGYNERYADAGFGAFAASNANLSLEELAALCPAFPLRETVEKFGKDASPFFTVQEPAWLEALNAVWTEENLETLKLMTMVKLMREFEICLDPAYYAEMVGLAEPYAPANAVAFCDRADTVGLLLGKLYVSDRWTDAEVERLAALTDELIAAFRTLLEETPWLGDASRAAMIGKLDKLRLNVLYPDGGYPDFSGLGLTATEDGGTLLGNYLKIRAWHNERQNARLVGESASALPVWDLYSPTNPGCFYDFDTNSINIMPGFAASQGYGADTSAEELLGVFGWIIAHEISHAFDFSGAQYNGDGVGESVLQSEDLGAYLALVDRLADYFSAVEAMPGVHVNGSIVKGEAAADLIGMQLALKVAEGVEGFDYAEFFRSAAGYMFMTLPNEDYAAYFISDEHPLHYLRVNVSAQMYPEFYETYGVQAGDGMYLPASERIRFWGP